MKQIILDKSFLDGANPEQLKSLFEEYTVLMPDVLFYELITTEDVSKKRCFSKFPDTTNPVEVIPNIGTLMRYELDTQKPCTPLYDRREKTAFVFHNGLRTGDFQFTGKQLERIQNHERLVEQDTISFFGLAMDVPVFFPFLNGIPYSEFPDAVKKAKRQMVSNDEKVREIYTRLLEHNAPANAIDPRVLDPNWAYFRWIQVRVIYSLSLLLKYQGKLPKNPSKKFWRRIEHEMIDAEYIMLGSLAGSMASNDHTLTENYQFICPGGLLLTLDL